MMTPQETTGFYTTMNTNANIQLTIIEKNFYPSSNFCEICGFPTNG